MRYERLPDYLNPKLEQCKKLTRVLQALDAKLVCAYNSHSARFEVWGPSKEYGWAWLTTCESPTTGQPIAPEAAPMLILEELKARQKDPNVKALYERQRLAMTERWMDWMDECGEAAAYFGAAVGQEASGSAIRYGLDDIREGYAMARDGRSKSAPKGQRIFVPGMGSYGA